MLPLSEVEPERELRRLHLLQRGVRLRKPGQDVDDDGADVSDGRAVRRV
jgi:hypothetical protein